MRSPRRNSFATWLVALVALAAVSGCAGTRQAYQAADTPEKTAYVVTEHYAAVLHEAADYAEKPGASESVKQRLKDANAKVAPLILTLKDLSEAYGSVKNAQNEAALSEALAKAVTALNDFILVVKEVSK